MEQNKHRSSIRTRIQTAFTAVIIAGGMLTVSLIAIFYYVLQQDRMTVNKMVEEYGIMAKADIVVKNYNDAVKNPKNPTHQAAYSTSRENLKLTIDRLTRQSPPDQRQAILSGISNTARDIIAECDAGLAAINTNNFESISDHYSKGLKYSEFIKDNTRLLMEQELGYLYKTQQSITTTYFLIIGISTLAIILFISYSLVYTRKLSETIVNPLIQLTIFAKRVASDPKCTVDIPFQENSDEETSSMTESITTMVHTLTTTLETLQKTNSDLEATKIELEHQNSELATMNKLMVGRELKMIEMKEEIKRLKSTTDTQS